jgi:ABC-type sugar transport system permease subunit
VSAGRTWAQTAGLIMIGPAVFLSALVVLGPFVYVVFQAFVQKKTGVIGLDNFEWLLGPAFVPALWNTLIISIGSVALEIIVAVPLALLLNERLHGRAALRGIVTLPWAIPTIAVATAFLWPAERPHRLHRTARLGDALGHRGPRLEGAAARLHHPALLAPVALP